jgi:hypothetical protein
LDRDGGWKKIKIFVVHKSILVIRNSLVYELLTPSAPGILRKSSGFGVFAEIFSKNIVIPSKEIPFFGEAQKRFWAIIAKFGFFGVLRMARIAKFG